MNFLTADIGLLVLYIVYRTYKKIKLKKEKELNDKWLAELQKTHDTKDYKEVIRLVDSKWLNQSRLIN